MHVTHPHRRRSALLTAAAALAVAGPLISAPPAGAADTPAAEVSPHAAQAIDNIGASGAWWVNDLKNFDPKVQARVAKLLFSKDGLDLSAYRYNIGGGGTGVTYAPRAPEDFLSDDGTYDWSRDKAGRTFLYAAAKYGVEDLIGFVNSAPAQWKTNGKSCGGHLKTENEQDFAEYIADVTDHFAEQGVRLDYISPFNEPTNSFDSCGQEGMLVDVPQRDDIVRALGAEQQARKQRTGIIADESTSTVKFNDEVPRWINEPGTAQYVDKLAHHTYDNPSDANRAKVYETAKSVGKTSWSTEICCFGKGGTGWAQEYDPTIDGGLNLSRIIYKDFATAHDSAFHWWVALSEMIGTDPLAKNDQGWNDGLIYYDPDYATNGNQTLYFTKRYYALGQYSKFVKPGSVMHDVTGLPEGVEASVYDRDGKWVVVVNNHNTTDTALDLHFNSKSPLWATKAVRTSADENWANVAKPSVKGGTVSASLPARSITTYVLAQKPFGATSAVTGAWQGEQSGKCLTANASGAAIGTCTGGAEQSWSYDRRGALKGANGYLTVGSSGLVASAEFTGDAGQRWLLNSNGQIVSEASGRCLDVGGQATADGSKVSVYTCNGGTNQAWFRQ
ncbi:ricin-type beta-trefoil lectin domain protein [Streptomyces sp. ISL-22]|uniref:glycoside hydrolase n=1 Tax=unclassified Streptomyces TaxID=2593676 RepID=UPI001BEBD919|nr:MULTISPECIES: glycoside hydrolase [unclassified Streptomyces]MBT2424005.1 ricin-type beta-trefoil lectin domain protein [Streptomyces sp. ISL-24]MBT2437862.1 ricin-type beta-trefoil lectin domain protein [Streptomyces sp. ISL-22]